MKSKKQHREENSPITFLHAEQCRAKVTDAPAQGCACENDTFIQGSGDSDTN